MTTAEMFSAFLSNLTISNSETIGLRYGELTSALNRHFRETESKEANTLQVGSFGRKTGINDISDLDMLYIMPKTKWVDYDKSGGQLKLLQDVRDAILKRYPTTEIRVDRLVVTVTYTNFHVEVQPVFEQEDQSYRYPDTKNGGSWKITKPRPEMQAVADLDGAKNSNLRRLCKMTRAWKNKHGVSMGGLLIDTLAFNFLSSTAAYDAKSFGCYDELGRDFFKYLADLPEQSEYAAPGSRQRVKVKKKFQRKAQKAYDLCLKAIESAGSSNVNDKWKKVYGRPFPALATTDEARAARTWDQTEEFIEDRFPIDIRCHMRLNCEVKQNGFRKFLLRDLLRNRLPLRSNKKLNFWIEDISVDPPFDVYWKVLNRGAEAERRNCIRGQIVPDGGHRAKSESSDFRGDHVVECYCVKDGVVVAKDRIRVPIEADGRDYE
ncbi:nucleotide-binding domain-containing protein [Pseudoxanthomonas suwonensis]|uniref:nucleotide-binding domain-containing protein n=1 Tax=Pseudoxanthomonas suwonensis TaxID=314722 RepID=UPI00138EEF5D|nr:nucleotidyltransferase [Pseudoxanthomonas suwonensis]KAF1701682.1 nucleotidyltransferase [Pseudoxanthomonas suwonensis]